MAYTVDAVQAKLSGLNETQESIVTVAQWVMFHRRHADKTAGLWRDHMSGLSASKRLNMIYLANEVVQQSKARRKDEFVNAFAPIIPEATELAYRGSSGEIQQKIRRVTEVWRQRNIFDSSALDSLESKIDELDKTKASAKKPGLGGSLFGAPGAATSIPSELQPIATLQAALSKAESKSKPAITNASTDFDKLNGSNGGSSALTPPVHASRLGGLLKSLTTADNAVRESIRARQSLIEGLETIIEVNKQALIEARNIQNIITERLESTDAKKREVEDNIMQGLSAPTADYPTNNTDDYNHHHASATLDDGSDSELNSATIQSRPLPQPPVSSLVSVLPTEPENVIPVMMPDVSNILASLTPAQGNNNYPVPSTTIATDQMLEESTSLGLETQGSSVEQGLKPATKRRRVESGDYDISPKKAASRLTGTTVSSEVNTTVADFQPAVADGDARSSLDDSASVLAAQSIDGTDNLNSEDPGRSFTPGRESMDVTS